MAHKDKGRLGLALGSGGARGWCHIGVLRELEDMGVRPDVIAGSSMGALVGAIYAGGALDELEDWALGLTARHFFGMLDIRLSSGGLVEGSEIGKVIRNLAIPQRIENLAIPLALVATDMVTGREVWLTEGPVDRAVRASVALPGIISPCLIDGRWTLDGGLTNPVPVSACRVLGADIVIAVNPNGHFDETFWSQRQKVSVPYAGSWREWLPDTVRDFFEADTENPPRPNYIDVLSVSIEIMTDHIRRSRLAGDPPHLLLDAHLMSMSVFDFHRAAEAIEEGRRTVRDLAEVIARLARI